MKKIIIDNLPIILLAITIIIYFYTQSHKKILTDTIVDEKKTIYTVDNLKKDFQNINSNYYLIKHDCEIRKDVLNNLIANDTITHEEAVTIMNEQYPFCK